LKWFAALALACLVFQSTTCPVRASQQDDTVRHVDLTDGKQEALPFDRWVRAVFAKSDWLFLAESHHFFRESRDLVMALADAARKEGCHDLLLECGPAEAFLADCYIHPGRPPLTSAMKQQLSPTSLKLYQRLRTLNEGLPAEQRLSIHGVDGYMSLPPRTMLVWQYLSERGQGKFWQEVRQAASAAPSRESVLLLRDRVVAHQAKLKAQLPSEWHGHFQELRVALDDVFIRDDINERFQQKTTWSQGAALREARSIEGLARFRKANPNRKLLALYGAWHVARNGSEEPENLVSHFRATMQGRIHTALIGFDNVALTDLEPSRDYDQLYWVYAKSLKVIHAFKDAHPDDDTMPFERLVQDPLPKLPAASASARLSWYTGPASEDTQLDRFDSLLWFSLGHYPPQSSVIEKGLP
jgi:hypothetical protein